MGFRGPFPTAVPKVFPEQIAEPDPLLPGQFVEGGAFEVFRQTGIVDDGT